jgi:aminoglycoside 3-N-acetyltransferase
MTGGYSTRAELRDDLAGLGIAPGDVVMVHAAVSRVGRMIGGPDDLIGALRDAVGPAGTVVGYCDWGVDYSHLRGPDGRVPDALRPHVPPFDPAASRAARENGVFPEFLRTTPGACRSGNPGASIAALGARAAWIAADHPLQYGYGEGSPFAKLVEAGGKVAMIGAPLDTITLLHHAEHLADICGKRVVRHAYPMKTPGGVRWLTAEEFDTSVPVVASLDDDYFARIVQDFLGSGRGAAGTVGGAPSVVVGAAEIVAFAVGWLEARCR